MRTPCSYLLEARQPGPAPPPGYLPEAQAERAIKAALADAAKEKETYAALLLRAIRNAKQPQP